MALLLLHDAKPPLGCRRAPRVEASEYNVGDMDRVSRAGQGERSVGSDT